jgi:hypothetical protein
MKWPQHIYAATVSADSRLILPAAVAATYAPDGETVVVAAPGGNGAGADHWRLYAPAVWELIRPTFGVSLHRDATRCFSSAIALPVSKTRRLTLGVAVCGLGLVLCPPTPFAAVLVALPGFCEVWPRAAWSRELERALQIPAALAGLRLDD